MSAVRVVLKRRDKVLLLQRSSDSNHEGRKWEIPGGVVESLEEILPALKREVREESGLVIYPSCTTSLTIVNDLRGYDAHIFICTRFRRRPGLRGSIGLSKEHRSSKWVTVEKALGMHLTAVTQEVMEFLLE